MIDLGGRSEAPPVATWTVLGSFSVGRLGGLHDLVRAGRAGDLDARAAILDGVRRAPPARWPSITSGIVVPVPGHLPGPPNELVVEVVETIATIHGWQPTHTALQRVAPAPEAKTGVSRTPTEEAATLSWLPPPWGQVIVMVDDVVRTGATLRACLAAIREAGDARPVVAIALARAVTLGVPTRSSATSLRGR